MATDQFPEQNVPAEPERSVPSSAAADQTPLPDLIDPFGPVSLEVYNDLDYLEHAKVALDRDANTLLSTSSEIIGYAEILELTRTRVEKVCKDAYPEKYLLAMRHAHGLEMMFRQGFKVVEQVLCFSSGSNADEARILQEQYTAWRINHTQQACQDELTAYLETSGAPLVAWQLFGSITNMLKQWDVTTPYGTNDAFVQKGANDDSSYWRLEGMLAALFLVRSHRAAREFEMYMQTHTSLTIPQTWFDPLAE